ncbi:MAG: EamA family transporter, partial [Bacillota bacterium]
MKNNSLAYLGLSTVAIIWGASFGINRMATEVFNPLLFVFLRFGLAVPLLFVILKITEGSVGIAKRDMVTLALIG